MIAASGGITNLNAALNVVTLLAAIAFAVPFLRARRKDGIIAELHESVESKQERLDDLAAERDDCKRQVRQLEHVAAHMREELAAERARYEEQSKYTAQSALEAVERMADKRHRELMGAMQVLQRTVER